MELLYFFLAAFVAVTANTVFSQDIITPSQEGQLRAGYATNLDTKYENNTGWRLPRYHTPKWFEYYNNTSHLNDMKENTTVCSSINQDFTTLSEKEGIWVACQDTDLPDDCSNTPSSPCHPILTYNTGIPGATVGLRTLKLTFALYGLATLRLSFGTLYNCFDFSKRSDPFSLCEYYEVDDSMETDGWTFVQFTFEPFSNVSFNTFSLQMISRFAKDVVLIDKIEATDVLLCGTVRVQPLLPRREQLCQRTQPQQ
ncbi:hypothetical protein Ocin01_17364 [Orchesella cincta]|uniref:MAM domain-containing protein n=1 Tax=Orchesella cincta TaxID=48709 RepID=A0A1D2M8K7_ORCCI|nr:hypothetical protein Ocin01_17364 [Orchesella cincta]